MTAQTRPMSADEARSFQTYSLANAVTVKEALPCGCEPYVDVFTYRRWKAQGFQVQRGEKAIRLPLIYQRTEKDPDTGEEATRRRMGRSAVFCRCQVKPIAGSQNLGDCPSCGGHGSFAGGRACRSCDGTGSRGQR